MARLMQHHRLEGEKQAQNETRLLVVEREYLKNLGYDVVGLLSTSMYGLNLVFIPSCGGHVMVPISATLGHVLGYACPSASHSEWEVPRYKCELVRRDSH